MGTLQELLEIERRLWANDADYYRDAYLEHAVLLFPQVGRLTRDAAVDAIRRENAEGRRWAEVDFEDATARQLTDDVHLLVYRAHARWNYEASPSSTDCATVYVHSDGRWRVACHQQTRV
ncbi:MAG TPA: nuclear transport factor 2 family protein [Sphingomicrobium sp.]